VFVLGSLTEISTRDLESSALSHVFSKSHVSPASGISTGVNWLSISGASENAIRFQILATSLSFVSVLTPL
jgi:hypothetical protein